MPKSTIHRAKPTLTDLLLKGQFVVGNKLFALS
jgi:hypothetical protein